MGISKLELAYNLLTIFYVGLQKPNNINNQRNRHNRTVYTTTDWRQETRKKTENRIWYPQKNYIWILPLTQPPKKRPRNNPPKPNHPPKNTRKHNKKAPIALPFPAVAKPKTTPSGNQDFLYFSN